MRGARRLARLLLAILIAGTACGRGRGPLGTRAVESDRAFVSLGEVEARLSPTFASRSAATLTRGMEITVRKRERDFFMVRLPDRGDAYLPAGSFERVSDRDQREVRAKAAARLQAQPGRAVEDCPVLLAPDYGGARWGSLTDGDDVLVVLADHDFYGIRLPDTGLAFVPARSIRLLPSALEEGEKVAGKRERKGRSPIPVVVPSEDDLPASDPESPERPSVAPLEATLEHEPPELVHNVEPRYPDAARRMGVGGEVVLRIVVDEEGQVGEVEVVKGAPAGLTEAALDAVKQRRYRPARRNGEPSRERIEVTVRFTVSR